MSGLKNPAREAAKAAGLKIYDAGWPCKFGHTEGKYVSTYKCVKCTRIRTEKHYNENEAHLKEYRKQYHKNNKETSRGRNVKRYFGITLEQEKEMMIKQNGKCKICERVFKDDRAGNRRCIDHCHTTNKIRGLLCMTCNMGIGNFNDSKELLLKSIEYLNDDSSTLVSNGSR